MRVSLAFVVLAACYRPELELIQSGRFDSPRTMLYQLSKEGDRVRASGPTDSSPERSGTLTAEGLRRLDAALTCLEDNWDPPYEVIAISPPTYTHQLLRDGWDVWPVVHEPYYGYNTEVLPLSDLTYAIELETLGCGGELVVVDEPAPDCAP